MEHVEKLIVSIQLNAMEVELGELAAAKTGIYFKYHANFIKRGLEISPIKLKCNTQLHKANELPFEGLFGVFADSLPDGWGRLLLDRSLASKGIDVGSITVLDRLAYVGSNGMGALSYKPEMTETSSFNFQMELDVIAKSTQQVLSGTATQLLDELVKLGGSSGGARPKILVGYHPKTQHLVEAQNNLPKGYQHWIIKFPSSFDRMDIANIEYAYYKMAIDAGIEMSESKLFKGQSGEVYFGTKRFDRVNNKRLHLHSAAGLMHDNFRLSTLDYGHLMDCAFILEKDVRAYEKIIRLAAFNVMAHNKDDHSKNISFLMDENGTWKLAPTYDLTFSSSAYGMHSTMVAGESRNPTKKHVLELANYFKVKKVNQIIDEVESVLANWKKYAKLSGVSKESMDVISRAIQLK